MSVNATADGPGAAAHACARVGSPLIAGVPQVRLKQLTQDSLHLMVEVPLKRVLDAGTGPARPLGMGDVDGLSLAKVSVSI